MGCFSIPRHERSAQGSPQSVTSTKSANLFSNNKPVELPNPSSLKTFSKDDVKIRDGRRLAPSALSDSSRPKAPHDIAQTRLGYSGPITGSNANNLSSFRDSAGHSSCSYSCDGDKKKPFGLKRALSLRRASSFGGRPQPLPLPVAGENKPLCLPLPAPQEAARGAPTGSTSSSSELRSMSGTSSHVSTSRPTSFVSQDGIGSWSNRRGRVTPVGGLPLPPPSVATKLLPSLEAFEFRDLSRSTRDFAPECCLEKGEFGAVYRAWIKDLSSGDDTKTEVAVVRLAVKNSQDYKDWKSELQMLAQLRDTNICMIKGYCTHEEPSLNGDKSQERILVFEQSLNGNLHDALFGSVRKTFDWSERITIALGAARGLMYLHDRAPLRIVYRDFKASNVLLDRDYTPRLAGYGLSVTSSPVNKNSSFATIMKISQEHAKSNVWSFGVLLLELLTGKFSRDPAFLCDERIFVQWGKPYMKEASKLSIILDPRLKGNCSMTGAVKVSMLVCQCLKTNRLQRPTMSEVVDVLRTVKETDCSMAQLSNLVVKMLAVPVLEETLTQIEDRMVVETQTSPDISSSSEDEKIVFDSVGSIYS